MLRYTRDATAGRRGLSWTLWRVAAIWRKAVVATRDVACFDPVLPNGVGPALVPAARLSALVRFLPCVLSVQVCADGGVQQDSLMDWDKVRPVLLVAVPLVGLAIWLIRWFAKHDQWMKGIDEFKRETKEALNEIRTDIKKLLSNLPPSVIGSTSPLQLTDLGREVSECVDASAWARRTAPELLDEVKGKSAYEIQEFCVAHMRNKHQPTVEQDRSFKECAYEHGIKLEQVLDVCALELRDRLLELVDSEATA